MSLYGESAADAKAERNLTAPPAHWALASTPLVYDLLRRLLPLLAVLAVPILPLLLLGDAIETTLAGWRTHPPPRPVVAIAVVALLASDLLLPIPSSLVGTLAGWQLGAVGGACAVWAGLSLGAAVGFALARVYGRPLAAWLTPREDLIRTRRLADRLGPLLLVLGRGIPVVAEATVLFVGMHGMAWRRFLPPVLLSNLGLALAYAAFGHFAEYYGWLPQALAISIALPAVLVMAFRAAVRTK